MTATESNDKPEDVKTSRLLTTIGESEREMYVHLCGRSRFHEACPSNSEVRRVYESQKEYPVPSIQAFLVKPISTPKY